MDSLSPGMKTSSRRFARPTIGWFSNPICRKISTADESCPFPPSTTIRSGSWRLLHNSRVPSLDNFFHAGEIIRADDCSNFEFSVIALARLAVNKDNHGCNRIASLDIRIVETFYPSRRRRKTQISLQSLECVRNWFLFLFPSEFSVRQA